MGRALTLIAAMGRNGAIGKDNRLLWQLPEDMRRFKALTLGHSVMMGRKTWESLPAKFRPLPGRQNIVLSRDPSFQLSDVGADSSADSSAIVARTLDDAISAATGNEIFVIGGAEIYRLAIARATRLELTEVNDAPEGDAFFPAIDRKAWRATSRVAQPATATAPAYTFVTYELTETATQST